IVDESRGERAGEAIRDLAMIGLDDVAGYFGADAVERWPSAGRALETVEQATADEVASLMASEAVHVVDVRGRAEWESGHMSGVPNIPVGYLGDRLAELPADRPVVVHCQSGARSAIAASVLLAKRGGRVINMVGGINAWRQAGLPVTPAGAADAALAPA
ncbi:MAG TPA: rhodanese-like domain-containing protein, partial [Gemmatimonadaceae bacterium]|nr:rhodanese-like domain-containing protein [Gemmatimonadaceae bacterium]